MTISSVPRAYTLTRRTILRSTTSSHGFDLPLLSRFSSSSPADATDGIKSNAATAFTAPDVGLGQLSYPCSHLATSSSSSESQHTGSTPSSTPPTPTSKHAAQPTILVTSPLEPSPKQPSSRQEVPPKPIGSATGPRSSPPKAPPPMPAFSRAAVPPHSDLGTRRVPNPYMANPFSLSAQLPIIPAPDDLKVSPPLSKALGLPYPPFIEPEQGWFSSYAGPARTGDKKFDMKAKHALAFRMTVNKVSTVAQTKNVENYKGKAWIAPKMLIREDKSLYFPNVPGKLLKGRPGETVHTTELCEDKISIICFISSQTSAKQCKSFVDPIWERFQNESSHFNLIHINHQPTKIRSFIVSFFVNNLRAIVPSDLQNNYIVSKHDLKINSEDIALGMENELVGYVYLVDENHKIRWAGCAAATAEEQTSLAVNTQILIDRLKAKQARRDSAAPSSTEDDKLGSELENKASAVIL